VRLWVTCSPKQAPDRLKLDPRHVSELKVVYPSYDPLPYLGWSQGHPKKYYIQPTAAQCGVGVSVLDKENMRKAADWCMEHPAWTLSMQTHKVIGLP